MKIKFHRNYFIWSMLLLATETAIAVFFKTGFIRHTFGDFLVVILLYCLIKSFWNAQPLTIGIIVLLIAYIIELLQLFNLLEYLNLTNSSTAKIILGNTFQFSDLVAYTLGILAILFIELQIRAHRLNQNYRF